jgi:protein SCO1/2
MEPQPRLEGVRLVDASDRAVDLAQMVESDAPVFVNFIFTSCTTICPVMSAGFSQFAARMHAEGRPLRLVSITIDPEHDTPARLRDYSVRHQAGANWSFLTGSRAAVEAAQQAFDTLRAAPESHTAATYLRRSRSAPWERIDGLSGVAALVRAYGDPPQRTIVTR